MFVPVILSCLPFRARASKSRAPQDITLRVSGSLWSLIGKTVKQFVVWSRRPLGFPLGPAGEASGRLAGEQGKVAFP